jgi:hypothetical protein
MKEKSVTAPTSRWQTEQVSKAFLEGAAWLRVVRKLYQEAWNSDRNELMIAWAKANL